MNARPLEPRKTMSAYADESESDQKTDPGTYLLSAAVLPASRHEEARRSLRPLLLPGQKKLHWYEDRGNDARHRKIVEAVAQLGCRHLVVIRSGGRAEDSERRRRLCMKRLLWELDQLGVAHVCLEARERKQNGRDRQLLDGLRAGRELGSRLRMDHAPGPEEPLLWIADAVAGAVVAARRGDSQYRALIDDQIREIWVD